MAFKAHVKINVIIHLENEGDSNDKAAFGAKYPLSAHHSGTIDVASIDEGVRVLESLANHVNSTFANMGVKANPPGQYVPDLSASFGGCPEPDVIRHMESKTAEELLEADAEKL